VTQPRVTYVLVPPGEDGDWADARYAVLLDGEKVGEVIKAGATDVHCTGGRRYGTQVTYTEWVAEGTSYRMSRRTRKDAAIDLLQDQGMSYGDAQRAVGRKGW